jgi:uncharacterized protein (TIGR02147 family)
MTRLKTHLFEKLIEKKTYREFLAEYLLISKESGETLSSLCKRAGLSSAGFLSDVIKGKKDISAKTLPALKKALLLPEGLDQYFEYLVFADRTELAPAHLGGAKLTPALRALRSRLKERHMKGAQKSRDSKNVEQVMGSLDAHVLFAALEPNQGLTRQELITRTGLSAAAIERGLDLFAKLKLTYEMDGKIHSHQENFENFGEEFNDQFQVTFQKALELLAHRATDINKNKTDLFYYSAFLVQEDGFENLQLSLQDQLVQALDKTLPATGERVAHLVFSVFIGDKKTEPPPPPPGR